MEVEVVHAFDRRAPIAAVGASGFGGRRQRSAVGKVDAVGHPGIASGTGPVVDGLRAIVVGSRDPGELGGTTAGALVRAAFDQGLREPVPTHLGDHVEVVEDGRARGARRRPREQQRGEGHRRARLVACEQLQPVASARGEQGEHERAQVAVARRHLVEIAVGPHQRQELVELAGGDRRDRERRVRGRHGGHRPRGWRELWTGDRGRGGEREQGRGGEQDGIGGQRAGAREHVRRGEPEVGQRVVHHRCHPPARRRHRARRSHRRCPHRPDAEPSGLSESAAARGRTHAARPKQT
jgi:hypothetical protein